MAGVPATTANDLQGSIESTALSGASGKGKTDLLAGFGNLDILRQLGLMIGLMASVAIGFAVVLWSQGSDYQPIYGNMQGYDASVIMEVLDSNGMDYRVDPS
jgi:flagellar M-ring protein FliF